MINTRTLVLAAAALCASVAGAFAQLNTQLKSNLPLGAETNDVFVSGNFAYVARGDDGMSILDVSNPAAPTLRGTFAPLGCHTHDVEVIGNLAYLANHVPNNSGTPIVGLYIADVSNPAAPVEVGRIEWGMGGGYHLGGSAYSIHIEARGPQRIAYIASNITSQLEVFDVTVPNAAVYLATYDNPLWAYYSNPHEMVVRGNLLVTSWLQGGITVDDVTNPAAPIRLAHAPSTPNYIYDVKFTADGSHIIATEAASSGGGIMRIRSLSSLGTGQLPLISTVTSPNATLFHNISVQGDYAAVANFQDGIRFYKIANPAAPVLAGWYDTNPTSATGGTTGGVGVAVSGQNVFLSHSSSGLYALDHIDAITITKAEWKNSTKTLTVEATTTGSPYLTLNVSGFGAMTYNPGLGRYVLTRANVARPATVTVGSDIGGSRVSTVRKR